MTAPILATLAARIARFAFCGGEVGVWRDGVDVHLAVLSQGPVDATPRLIANRFAGPDTASELRAVADHLDQVFGGRCAESHPAGIEGHLMRSVRASELGGSVAAPKSGDLLAQLGRVVIALTRRVSALEAELAADRARVDGLARRLHDKVLHDAARTKGAARAKARQLKAQSVAAMAGRPDPAVLLASLPPAVRDIVQQEAAAHGVSELAVLSVDAHAKVARARRHAMARAVALPMSLCAVGRLFDRNHATVSWARETYAAEQGGAT